MKRLVYCKHTDENQFVATVESAGTDINKSVLVSTQDGGISTAKYAIPYSENHLFD